MSYEFRGLTNFITDIRYCSSKEEEVNRVEKELAHIRETFVNPKKISVYERKKFCLKLMYMNILGYPIDFGHMEAMELIFSPKYQDKIIGYTVLSVFINERSEILRLVSQSLLSDLGNRRIPFQTISLSFIANCGNNETAETLANNVAKILMNPTSTTYLLKKASLCLLHLYRKNKEVVPPSSYVDKIKDLLRHTDGGVLTAVLSLLVGLAQAEPSLFEDVVPVVCSLMNKVVLTKYVQGDYMYDHIPAPWLIVKGFQFLQYYNTLPNDNTVKDLEGVLKRIINTDSKNFAVVNPSNRHLKRHNAMLAVLVEAINVVVKLHMEAPLVQRSIQHIRYFMSIGDPDMRYLSLEAAQVLCPLDPTTTGDDPAFVSVVEKTLRHPDISLRRRALDVLFEMCSEKNSGTIVNKLVEYLDVAEYELKEELVLKIGILAEKYPVDNKWYLDIIFRLIQTAGEASPQEIWYRTVQIISTQPAMQEYAATLSLKVIRVQSIPENAVRISAYLLGEYHQKLPNQGEDEGNLEEAVFKMQHHYKRSNNPTTQAIVISGLSKIAASPYVTPEIKDNAQEFIKTQVTNVQEDTQERAVEAVTLIEGGAAQAASAFALMPSFTVRQSILLKDLKKKVKQRGGVEKGSTHLEGVKDVEEEDEEAEEQKNKEALQSAKNAAKLAEAGGVAKAPVASSAPPAAAPAPQRQPQPSIPLNVSTVVAAPRPTLSPVESAFRALLTTNEGVLYEDPNVRVNYQVIEYSSKPADGVSFNFNLIYTSKVVGIVDKLKTTIGNNVGELKLVPGPINPNQIRQEGKSVTQRFDLTKTLQGLFVDPPTIDFSYSFGLSTQTVTLKLPVILHKYFIPITPPAEEFQKAWNSIPSNSPLEAVHVFLAKGQPITPAGLNEIVKSLTGPLKFQFLKQYDTTPNTLCFASSLKVNKLIPIMLKLAPAAQGQITITVKSTDPLVTTSIRKYVIELFV